MFSSPGLQRKCLLPLQNDAVAAGPFSWVVRVPSGSCGRPLPRRREKRRRMSTRHDGRRRQSGAFGDREAAVPPEPDVTLDEKPGFEEAVARIREIMHIEQHLPPAPPSEQKVYAELDNVPRGRQE